MDGAIARRLHNDNGRLAHFRENCEIDPPRCGLIVVLPAETPISRGYPNGERHEQPVDPHSHAATWRHSVVHDLKKSRWSGITSSSPAAEGATCAWKRSVARQRPPASSRPRPTSLPGNIRLSSNTTHVGRAEHGLQSVHHSPAGRQSTTCRYCVGKQLDQIPDTGSPTPSRAAGGKPANLHKSPSTGHLDGGTDPGRKPASAPASGGAPHLVASG